MKQLPMHVFRVLCVCSLGALNGCGYHQGELFDEQYRTIATPIFENSTFYRGMEFDLTEALTKELELRTPYKVVSSAKADTILQGTIISVNQRLLSRTFDGGISEEVQLVMQVSYEWKDMRTGEVIRKRGQILGTGEYIPRRGVNEPVEVARHQAVSETAREIVSSLRADW